MSYISNRKVPYSGPEDAEILVVGEAPGYEEDKDGIPFIGDAGQLIRTELARNGIDPSSVRFANVCNYRPANNNFDYLKDSPQLKEGVKEIHDYINQNKEKLKLIILCGSIPLEYIGGKYGIHNWRGSVIRTDPIVYASLHPAAIVRDRREYPIFAFDIGKAIRYYRNGYQNPNHEFIIDPKGLELYEALQHISESPKIAIDIEGVKGKPQIRCVGVATSSVRSYCFVNHSNDFGIDHQFWKVLEQILAMPNAKIFHNGMGYDCIVFKLLGYEVTNYRFDTLIAAHVLEPELPRDLGTLTSFYTDEPYYKDKGKSSINADEKEWNDKIDKNILYEYNCIDCITTFQIAEKQEEELREAGLWDFFLYEMDQIDSAMAFSTNGMLIDRERRQKLASLVEKAAIKNQVLLNAIAGKKVNVNGKKDLHDVVFNQFKLPIRKNKKGNLTTDEDAIVSLMSVCKTKIDESIKDSTKFEWQKKLGFLKLVLLNRGLLKLASSYLENPISADDRARSIYKIPGTETGRWSCSMFIDNTGWNAQTLPRESLEE